ncbi:MAG: C40 family peptidase [Treponema sp.]|jgi:cell wall-associated NlpC family hydrolase|nr:C40 family peptidase [Treponema sp.]
MKKAPALLFLCLLPVLGAQEEPRDKAGAAPPEKSAPPAIAGTAPARAGGDEPELDIEAVYRRLITTAAREYLGVPYRYAGVSPQGFDCSGFIYFIYREAAGMEVSRSSAGLWGGGKKITLAQVRPGDVLLFTTVRAGPSHAGIVLENGPGGVLFIHAASQGAQTGVIISNLNEGYYKARFLGARNYF